MKSVYFEKYSESFSSNLNYIYTLRILICFFFASFFSFNFIK